jgi:hypothetical protein
MATAAGIGTPTYNSAALITTVKNLRVLTTMAKNIILG